MRKLKFSRVIIVTAVLSALAASAHAQTPIANYYVGPGGSDTNPGTAAAPFATVNKALGLCNGGETVAVASGTYNGIRDQKVRTSNVTVVGYGSPLPTITGTGNSGNQALFLTGGQYLTFDSLKFAEAVMITDHPTLHQGQQAHHISIQNCDLSAPGTALTIRSGAHDITLDDSYVHDSANGISGPNQPDNCNNINITNNVVENFTADAIQFGHWDNVLFEGNVVRYVSDPADVIHNDTLQFTGGSQHVIIRKNVIAHSNDQLILIQPAFGAIDDVLVENNLIYDSGAVAIQSQGVTNARFINNTVWFGGLGGLLLRGYNGLVPNDTIVANNVLSSMSYYEGATAAYEDYNYCASGGTGAHDSHGGAPGFIDTVSENFRPAAGSPLLDAGTATYAPGTDLSGETRTAPPSIGAYEDSTSSTLFVYDGFNYAVTSNIGTSSGSTTDYGWTGTTWTGTNAVVSPGLYYDLHTVRGNTYSGLPVEGNALAFGSNVGSARTIDVSALPATYTVVDSDGITRAGKPGVTLWISFLLRMDAAGTSTSGGGLSLTGATTGGGEKLMLGDLSTNNVWAISKPNYPAKTAVSGTTITTGQITFLVAKLTYVTGANNDTVQLYVNPPLGPNPPAAADATLSGADLAAFDKVQFKSSLAATGDEVRIGTTWRAVTSVGP